MNARRWIALLLTLLLVWVVASGRVGTRWSEGLQKMEETRRDFNDVWWQYRKGEGLADSDPACDPARGIPCRFLFPGVIKEQATKAQSHLYQLGLMATALNRTLVLPTVGGSRFTLCTHRPFDFYFAPDAVSNLGIRTITAAQYDEWALQRSRRPTVKRVAIAQAAVLTDGHNAQDPVDLSPKKFCLSEQDPRFEFGDELTLYAPPGFHKMDEEAMDSTGKALLSSLLPTAAGDDPDVLLIFYSIRHSMISPAVVSHFNPTISPSSIAPFSHFLPSPMWTNLASLISERIGPYIAIHWRIELLPLSHLSPCATSLVDALVAAQQAHPSLSTVYLATDYPLELLEDPNTVIKANSDTFTKYLAPEHHAALHSFVSQLQLRAPSLKLTSYARQIELFHPLPSPLPELLSTLSTPDPTLTDLDRGIAGLIDKLVATNAQYFLAGDPDTAGMKKGVAGRKACAKDSSYTAEIVEGRREKGVGKGEERWNDVRRFSMPKRQGV